MLDSRDVSEDPGPDKVRCPECGEAFSRRGLPGHRRFKHASPAVDGLVPGPGSEVRLESTRAPMPGAQETKAQTHLLARLADTLDRIEERLGRMEAFLPLTPRAQGARATEDEPNEETKGLLRDLQRVLREIAKLRAEREQIVAQNGAADPAAVREFDLELGRLRKLQAGVLFRLGKDAPGAPSDGNIDRAWF